MPPTDYGTIYLYWRELLMPYHGLDRNFDCSSLAKVTKSYPLPQIREAVEKVLTPRRIIQLKYRPLQQLELYEAIMEGPEPVTEKEFNKLMKWFKKTPLAKQRGKLMAIAEKKREQENKQKEKMQQQKRRS